MTPELTQLYLKYKRCPVKWGEHDCVLWAARCLDVQLGTNYERRVFAEFHYACGFEALRHVRRNGGLERLVVRYLGPAVPIGQVPPGGIVVVRVRRVIEALGLATPNGVLTTGQHGLMLLPYEKTMRGWPPCRRSS